MIGIYKIKNNINGKCYIGQSINIERRWNDEKKRAFQSTSRCYNYPLSRAFRKYGIENFTFEVLEECKREELNEKEKFWIAKYNSYFNGYNQNLGGESGGGQVKKESIKGIIKDLRDTNMYHKDIASKWKVSIELVQGINTGRYWYQDNIDYPIQKPHFKAIEINYCKNCGAEITKKATLCVNCCKINSRKVKRPEREELKKLIRTKSFLQIGKEYGVSDNAIRKWCDQYKLPRKKSEIKKKSDEEWELI